MTAPARRAFVLGGGVAGLTAAFGLAERGFAVELLESRRQVGGRAFATLDRATGRWLDNGPHVMLGCYRGMRALLARLGTTDGFQQDRTLRLAYRFAGGRVTALSLSSLPVPLAMPAALLRLDVPFAVRWRALAGMTRAPFGAPAAMTLADWLARRRQTGAPDALLWRPLCRAIMNVEPEQASARDYLAALREAFLGSARTAAFWLPKRPWSELLAEPAPAALARAGVRLSTGARVVGLDVDGGRVAAVALGDGARREVGAGDLVVSALPWFALRALAPPGLTADTGALVSSPIVTANFLLPPDRPALAADGPVVALVDGAPFHFVLRRPGEDVRQFALLSGGDKSLDGRGVDEIAALATQQLRRFHPDFDGAATVRIRKEQHATFVASPGSASRRPAPGPLPGGAPNLMVCGDWTATGLPATLEGAVRSAERLLQLVAPARAAAAYSSA